jgi:hypothetical protein
MNWRVAGVKVRGPRPPASVFAFVWSLFLTLTLKTLVRR